MPFDSSKPADHSPLVAAEMRGQLNGLNDKIDAAPAGPPGAPGQGFVFRGEWDGSAGYMPYDVVTHAGAAFLCVALVLPTPVEPQDIPTHWHLFAQRGSDGTQGGQGIQGPPGEVTNAAMDGAMATAIAGTSNNTNGVATLETAFADPDSEALRLKINELILAQRR
jgi:hypothetical protein